MSNTINMNLILPVPTQTLGPAWATQVNNALTLIDEHDHSSGKGRKITPAGLNISSDLTINSNNLLNVRSVRFNSQPSALSGPSDVNSVNVVNGDLYFNNSSGVSVQLTDGSNPAAAPAGASVNYERFTSIGPTLTISSVVSYSYVDLDSTSNAITVNLPAANSVAEGRFFVFKDQAGTAATNNITINASGADEIDGAASLVMSENLSAFQLVSNGSDAWTVLVYGSISTVRIADGAVVDAKIDASTLSKINNSSFLGEITAFHDYNGAVPTPRGWMLCNGNQVTEANYNAIHGAGTWAADGIAAQALNNKFLPNLNGRYATGAASTTQDGSVAITAVGNANNTINIAHTHTIPSHNHVWYVPTLGSPQKGQAYTSSGALQNLTAVDSTTYSAPDRWIRASNGAVQPNLYGATENNLHTNNWSGNTGSTLSSSQSIRPDSIEVKYIIRVGI